MTLQQLLSNQQRPLVMAILNATPDSFSGDGVVKDLTMPMPAANNLSPLISDKLNKSSGNEDVIVKIITEHLRHGMDIIDVGAESTRPGATPVPMEEEIARLIPIIKIITKNFPSLPISIDTQKPAVAATMLAMGATIINDVGFGRNIERDKEMLTVLKQYKEKLLAYIVMHNAADKMLVEKNNQLGHSYQGQPRSKNLQDINNFFRHAIKMFTAAGLPKSKIILDVGFGFGKSIEDSLYLINHIADYKKFGAPLLLGLSRKSFIGKLLGRKVDERVIGGVALQTAALQRITQKRFLQKDNGAIVRVHDITPNFDMARIIGALQFTKKPDYIIAVGSNMGDRKKNIRLAVAALNKIGKVKKISPLYQTAPQYNQDQQDFLNGALLYHGPQEPHQLLAELKIIEKSLGREETTARNQPRPIDLDIIAYGEQILASDNLTIPHPLAFERAFVLQPLLDLKPWFVFRDRGCYARDLLAPLLTTQTIKKI